MRNVAIACNPPITIPTTRLEEKEDRNSVRLPFLAAAFCVALLAGCAASPPYMRSALGHFGAPRGEPEAGIPSAAGANLWPRR